MSQVKLTGKRLREVVNYDPATGVFTWVEASGGRWKHNAGDVAGTVRAFGYRAIRIDGVECQAAHLAWLLVHGEMPKRRNLRFKDGNRDNAAIDNLTFGRTDSKDPASMNTYQREYRASNPMYARAKRLKMNFGIDLAHYQAMFVAQGGVCACCKKPETAVQKGKPLWLCVDHDHADGSIRGILCQHCNKMLGHAFDNQDTLAAAIAYLQAHAAKPKTNVIPMIGRKVATGTGE